MKIAILNASTLVSSDDVATIALAEQQALADFAGEWGLAVPIVVLTVDPSGAGLADEDCLLVILDDADQAGALGYHASGPTGQPYARVFARDSIAGLTGQDPGSLAGVQPSEVVLATVSTVVDHEAKEALCDPFAGDWADDGVDSTAWAKEACDPVESDSYTIDVIGADGHTTVTVAVSNHVLPAFFDPSDETGPWDHLHSLTGPFTIAAGGYAITEEEGQVSQTFGDDLPAWRRAQHEAAHPASRTGKRLGRHTSAAEPAKPAPAAAGVQWWADPNRTGPA